MGSIATGGLSERLAMMMYYLRELFLAAGYAAYSLFDCHLDKRDSKHRHQKIILYISCILFSLGVIATCFTKEIFLTGICIFICMFMAGVLGAFTLKLIARRMNNPFIVSVGESASVFFQWLFQFNDKLTFLTPVIVIIVFPVVIILSGVNRGSGLKDGRETDSSVSVLSRPQDVNTYLDSISRPSFREIC